jgi:hypothetical protein
MVLMNGGAIANHLSHWLSEYPRFHKVINHPWFAWTFAAHPPPREDNNEWTDLITRLDDLEFESSTGEKPSDTWPTTHEEPPF